MRQVLVILTIVLACCQAAPAGAQSYEQLRRWCFGDSTDDETVKGCSAVVEQGRETAKYTSMAYGVRGLVYRHYFKYDQAIADFSEALRLQPENFFILTNRGETFGLKGDWASTIEDYDLAIKIDPNFSEAWEGRGYARLKLGHADQALDDFDTAVRLDGINAEAMFGRALAKHATGDAAGATADFAAAAAQRPGIADDMARQGWRL